MENEKLHRCGKNSTFEYVFYCEGCGNCHGFRTASWPQPSGLTVQEIEWFKSKWSFNGNFEKPTVNPSLLIHDQDKNGNRIVKCHSYIRDGKIEYLSDCNHSLAGKTIDLPDF